MTAPLRILLADDHGTVRQGLKLLIDSQPDMTVVGEAADGDEVIERARVLDPDLVVIDVSMPGTSGLVATRTLKRDLPEVAVVVLTRHDDEAYVEDFLRAGASGYVLKQSAPADFLQAVRSVAAGGIYLDPAMSPRVAEGLLARKPQDRMQPRQSISDREASVLRLIAVGFSNKEVAAQLEISVKTVEVHKTNAMRKLGLTGRVDIVRYGVLQGWLYDT